jgi:hypothetical protein
MSAWRQYHIGAPKAYFKVKRGANNSLSTAKIFTPSEFSLFSDFRSKRMGKTLQILVKL